MGTPLTPFSPSQGCASSDAQDAPHDPTIRLIAREARRRGIELEMLDEQEGYFRLRRGSSSVMCRESLTELTSAIAMSWCDDKRITRRVLERAGLRTPPQIEAGDPAAERAFLREHGAIVVKPARGEQGRGVSVGIRSLDALAAAIERAGGDGASVILEQAVHGEELRLVLIGFELVAASVRRPPRVIGDGRHSIAQLIDAESRRRAAATAGHACIALDAETERCVADAGYALASIVPAGETVIVRRAANLHQGGTLLDVTAELDPRLAEVGQAAARALDIPVVGIDLIVPSIHGGDYWIIEANERPGLANHEPQPTAERFIDLLFPETE